MNINELYDININIYKNFNCDLVEYLKEINNDTFVEDVEEYYNKSFSELTKQNIAHYIYEYLSRETLLEKLLDDLYPEIDITYES